MLLDLFHRFSHELALLLDGASVDDYYVQIRPHFVVLKKDIEGTKPLFQESGSGAMAGGENRKSPFIDSGLIEDISIESVAALISERTIKEPMHEVPKTVYKQLIDMYVPKWNRICNNMLASIQQVTQEMLQHYCDKYFGSYKRNRLYNDVRSAIRRKLANTLVDLFWMFCF